MNVTLSKAASTIELAIATKTPIMLQGAPGVGKSDVVRSVAKKLGYRIIDIRLSQLDPVDLRGIPSTIDGKTVWNTPGFLPTDPEEKVLIFLDEINSAAQAVQAAAYQLVLDRKLGDYELPKNVVLVAAGNRTNDRAIVNQMATPLKNRFMHLTIDLDYKEWNNWALSAGLPPIIVAFMRYSEGKHLHEMLAAETETDAQRRKRLQDHLRTANAFATPRTWEYASRFIGMKGLSETDLRTVLTGCIGELAALEFIGYYKYWSQIPDLERVAKEPTKVAIPQSLVVCHAVALAMAVKTDKDNFENFMTYLQRMDAEFPVAFLQDVARAKPELLDHPTFIEWTDRVGCDLLLG